jgi:RNA polymerase sigma factor (sigma-70 family)
MAVIPGSPEAGAVGPARASDPVFEELFGRHHHALRKYCRSLVKDEQDSLDVLQNVALRVLLALRRGGKPEHERPWLYRIAHNEAMSLFRARRQTELLDERLMDPEADPSRAVLAREHLSEVVADVHALGPQARQILLMSELRGLSRADIGAALGLTPGAVSQSLSATRNALRLDQLARDTPCDLVRSMLSEPDARRHRTRTVRAHLRSCRACRGWVRRDRRVHRIAAILPPPIATLLRSLESSLGGGPGSALLAVRASVPGNPAGLLGALAAGAIGLTVGAPQGHRSSATRAPTAVRAKTAPLGRLGRAHSSAYRPLGVLRRSSAAGPAADERGAMRAASRTSEASGARSATRPASSPQASSYFRTPGGAHPELGGAWAGAPSGQGPAVNGGRAGAATTPSAGSSARPQPWADTMPGSTGQPAPGNGGGSSRQSDASAPRTSRQSETGSATTGVGAS